MRGPGARRPRHRSRISIGPDELETFLTIAEHGSFSKAAEQLSLAQPSISNRVQRLERTLRTRLFERTNRAVILTADGERLRTRVEPIIRDLHAVIEEFCSDPDRRQRSVVIAATPMLAVAGLIGLVVAVTWLLVTTDRPYDHPRLSALEQAELGAGAIAEAPSFPPAPLIGTIARPEVLATAFAFFGYAYLLFFFLSWFPSYLTSEQHLSIKSMSVVAAIPWVLGVVGNLAGGWFLDMSFRRTGRTLQARKNILVVCLMLAAVFVALAGLVHGLDSAVALMAASLFFLYITGPTYFAILIDLVEGSRVGAASGFVHLSAACAGIVAPSITGFMVQSTGSFAGAFVLAGAVACVGALGVLTVVRAPAAPHRPGPLAPRSSLAESR